MSVSHLPLPSLSARAVGSLHIITDDALAQFSGVRVAFTGTVGGVSEGAYESLNLASHVGDRLDFVEENRRRLLAALDASSFKLVVPNQVHGDEVLRIRSAERACLDEVRQRAAQACDGLIVDAAGVAALLCFADCVPVIIVSPTGRFAVLHAGWRGVVAGIVPKALSIMAQEEAPLFADERDAAASYNVYVGPHIRQECFETGPEVLERFTALFGPECQFGISNVSLVQALSRSLLALGVRPERIADAQVCTVCGSGPFYSYRASGGTCGRHGALAFRRE